MKEVSDGRLPPLFGQHDSGTISEAEEEYFRKMLSERRASYRPQPKETVPYVVQGSDTIEGIAARYNVTPSELLNLNKLSCRTVFPGQTIYIPEKNSIKALEEILNRSAAAINAASSSSHGSPKPGHVERIPGGLVTLDDTFTINLQKKHILVPLLKDGTFDGERESLRINSKFVTDGEGVVSGVLIVTTNHIMFDPNVSDPLVIEYGMEKYGVEAPMACIVRAALYTDIFRMRLDSSGEHVNVYHSKRVARVARSKSHEDSLGKLDKHKHLRFCNSETDALKSGLMLSKSFQENLSKICEQADDGEDDEYKEEADSSVPPVADVTDDNNTQVIDENKNRTVKKSLSATSSIDSDDGPPSRKASMSDDDGGVVTIEFGSPKKRSSFEKTKSKLHKGLKRLSMSDSLFPNLSTGRRLSLPLFPSLQAKTTSSKIVADSVKSPEVETGPCSAAYVNMLEEKPELFAPLENLIPRPAKSFCNIPLYLCLRMGNPVVQQTPAVSHVLHFGQKMKPEYWFSIPKDNVDSLYHFFLRWCPEKYGELHNIDYEELGYTRIETCDKTELDEEKAPNEQQRATWGFSWRRKSKDASDMTTATPSSPEDWEFLDYLTNVANSVHVPELLTPSTILAEEQILEIGKHLPARAMNTWTIIYDTTSHGFSLKTMYRKMLAYDCPVLIVIQSRVSDIFGAFLSSPLKMSDHFYGTGESFLFSFAPEFKVFHWAGENSYFIKGNPNSFMIGSSEGHFGLWLDDDLFRGRTNSCQTFANDPLCAEKDFIVKSLEAWGFV